MQFESIIGRLNEEEIELLVGFEEEIKETGDVNCKEEWATFFAFNRPELMSNEIKEQVVAYYEEAIAAGISRAMLNLGAMYYEGTVLQRDFKKAFELYQKAAEGDDTEICVRALCNLGYCYYYGRDREVDYQKAFECYSKGALLGQDPNCIYKLGDMYNSGKFVEKDTRMAEKLYTSAFMITNIDEPAYPDVVSRYVNCKLNSNTEIEETVLLFQRLMNAKVRLYDKIYRQKDPFADVVLERVEELIERVQERLDLQE